MVRYRFEGLSKWQQQSEKRGSAEEEKTYMISLTQPTDDLLDLGKSLGLVGLLLGLLSLANKQNQGER